ncbi:hypothetical protein RUM43_009858 [Polyplax serrata]|uniref:Uncharacterized protein n=1 Tax=Polyplax serrata TaxID=468196 RepID=A0AAN8P7T9_POLSC
MPITEGNYIEACDFLKRKFDNKREITIVLANRLLQFGDSLKAILNQFNEARQSILSVVKEEELWDMYTNISNHLSEGTCNCWKPSQGTFGNAKIRRVDQFSKNEIPCKARMLRKKSIGKRIQSVQGGQRSLEYRGIPCTKCKSVITCYYAKIQAVHTGQFMEVFPHKKLIV